jgi:TRAP-type C4-dicarboxylate transport system permease small subunit
MKIEKTAFWKWLLVAQKILIMVTIFAAMAILVAETIGRPLGFNFKGYEEVLVLVIFWCYMIGCGYGSGEESQITADILGVIMKRGLPKNIVMIARYTLTLALGIVMFIWTIQLAQWAIERNTLTTVYRLPSVIGYISMPVGLGISTFYNAVYFIREIRFFIKREDHPSALSEGKETV